MKVLICILTLWSFLAWSQTGVDLRFLETQRTSGSPFKVPVSFGSNGEISFLKDAESPLHFQPTMHVFYSRKLIQYSGPIAFNRFDFYPILKNVGWIELKSRRWEAGLGITALLNSWSSLGLVPYKGSLQTLLRHKKSKEEPSLPFRMPRKLSEIDEWKVADTGIFQTFGGITLLAALPAGVFHLVSGQMGVQNQFLVKIEKTSPDDVVLSILEENLKRRQLTLGPVVSDATFGYFKAKKLSLQFVLHPSNPEHHKLFEEAIKGNIALLQTSLPKKEQTTKWEGSDREYYIGIPTVAGRSKKISYYEIEEDGLETELDMNVTSSTGIFRSARSLQDLAHSSKEGLMVVWASEMARAPVHVVQNRFLSKGRILGLSGFEREIPQGTNFGSVVSQVVVPITRKEVEELKLLNPELVLEHYQARCEKEELPCRREWYRNNNFNKLKDLLAKPWEEMKRELGLLFLKEPALIYGAVKALNIRKDVYFKFLSENFQSLEGTLPIGL